MEYAIIAHNIKRYFKAGDGTTVHALDGVSMEIKKGTLAILKGRSGSGKTTLDRKSTRLNSSHRSQSRMPSSA